MAPFLAGAIAAGAAAVISKVVASEWRRINELLYPQEPVPVRETARRNFPTLRRDPLTGIYRPD